MNRWIVFLALLAVSACSNNNSTSPTVPPTTTAPYSQTDLVVGIGTTATAGNTVTATYSGWLHDSTKPDAKGKLFQSGTLTPFVLGTGRVIRGMDLGLLGMRVGGQRRLVIPPDLAYGTQTPDPASIPPNATLIFDVTLTAVQP